VVEGRGGGLVICELWREIQTTATSIGDAGRVVDANGVLIEICSSYVMLRACIRLYLVSLPQTPASNYCVLSPSRSTLHFFLSFCCPRRRKEKYLIIGTEKFLVGDKAQYRAGEKAEIRNWVGRSLVNIERGARTCVPSTIRIEDR